MAGFDLILSVCIYCKTLKSNPVGLLSGFKINRGGDIYFFLDFCRSPTDYFDSPVY